MPTRARKEEYFARMTELLDDYKKVLIVGANNVGSFQMQKIRMALRGNAVVLMGKNTMMRRILSNYIAANPDSAFAALAPLIVGNIGMIFTNGDLPSIRKIIEENRVPAAAKSGAKAECDVIVPPGPTGCDPGQTSWFQALNVPTKIAKGQIEIVSELLLVKAGDKVGSSEAALLQKLNMKPFTYGLTLDYIYDDGALFSAKILDITDDILKAKFTESVRRMAAISLAAGYPTLASLPHSIGKAVKRMIAIASQTGFTFDQMSEWADAFPKPAAEEEAAAEE